MLHYLLLAGIVIALFLTLLLARKENKVISDYLLQAWLASMGYLTFIYYLVYNQQHTHFPGLIVSGFCFPLLQGPFMYLYIKYQTRPSLFSKTDLLHLLPFLICSLQYIDFYFLSSLQKSNEILHNFENYAVRDSIRIILTYISGSVYCTLTLIHLLRYRKNLKYIVSNFEKIKFTWLVFLNISIIVIWIAIIFIQNDAIIFGAGAVFIFWMGYFGIAQVNIFTPVQIYYLNQNTNDTSNDNSIEQTVKERLKDQDKKDEAKHIQLQQIYQSANSMLDEEQLFLNPDLKLVDLAMKLQVHPNVLSRSINEVSGKAFYDIVNEKRINEFIRKLSDPKKAKFKIMALAFESGFNSKASFNRNFKEITGISPSDYKKSLSDSQINTDNIGQTSSILINNSKSVI